MLGRIRIGACLLAVALTAGAAAANTTAGWGRVVLADGTVRYDYGRRPAPELICRPHYVCDITLDGGESVLNLAIGDAAHWTIASGQSGPGGTTPHVFVKPAQAGLDTDLVITTSKRVYTIALQSVTDGRSERLAFRYPDEEAAARAAAADHERAAIAAVLAATPQVAPDAADTKYVVSGDASLAPEKVFNDGARTFIIFKALPGDLPAVVAVGKDGHPKALDFRVVGTTYVVDALEPNLDLVVGHARGERRASIRHA